MAEGLVKTFGGGELLVSCPLSGGNDSVGTGMRPHQRFECGAIAVVTQTQPDVTTAASHDPDNRWTITGPCPVAAHLVGPWVWWGERISGHPADRLRVSR